MPRASSSSTWSPSEKIEFQAKLEGVLQNMKQRSLLRVTAPDIQLNELAARFGRTSVPDEAKTMSPTDYLEFLEKEVIEQEVLQTCPTMIGHMTSVLPEYAPEMSRLVTAANLNLVKTETGKATTFLEREALAMMHREVFCLPDAFYNLHSQRRTSCLGVVTSGGTTANLQAMWMARKAAFPDAEERGLVSAMADRGCRGAVVVCSMLVHYSLDKAVAELGLGRQSLVKVRTDEHFKVDLAAFADALAKCRAEGLLIMAVVGIAGATETGSIDDLTALAKLAKDYDAHFHVDAAWGGGLLMTPPPLRSKLAGIELADTVVVDGHKQLYTPMGLGMLLIRDPESRARVQSCAKYIIREDSYDQGRFTLEGSRPANAVYLHMNLLCLGRNGLGARVQRGCALAQHMAALLAAAEEFELISTGPLTNVLLYRYLPLGFRELRQRQTQTEGLNKVQESLQSAQSRSGLTFVSRTTVQVASYGHQWLVCLRVVLGNTEVTEDGILRVLADQRQLVSELGLDETSRPDGSEVCPSETFGKPPPPCFLSIEQEIPVAG